jgi:hypothetical protein
MTLQGRALRAGRLVMRARSRTVEFAGRRISLPHKQFALLATWAQWAKEARVAGYAQFVQGRMWERAALSPGILSSACLYAPAPKGRARSALEAFAVHLADTRGATFDQLTNRDFFRDVMDDPTRDATFEKIAINRAYLQSELSRLRRTLAETFPPHLAELLGAGGDPQKQEPFTVALPPHEISIREYDSTLESIGEPAAPVSD